VKARKKTQQETTANTKLAEREGFEPPIRLPVCRISSAVLSTTQPPLRGRNPSPVVVRGVLTKEVRRNKGGGGPWCAAHRGFGRPRRRGGQGGASDGHGWAPLRRGAEVAARVRLGATGSACPHGGHTRAHTGSHTRVARVTAPVPAAAVPRLAAPRPCLSRLPFGPMWRAGKRPQEPPRERKVREIQ
jgi:hypothetical protein